MRLLVIICSDFLSVTRKQFKRQRALVKLIEGPEDVKTAVELDREAAAAFDTTYANTKHQRKSGSSRNRFRQLSAAPASRPATM
jgi:hypothetical protein